MQTKVAESDFQAVAQWRGRRFLLSLVFLSLLPTLVAGILYWSGWQPQGRHVSLGVLLDPVRPLPDVMLRALDGSEKPLGALRGKWLLVTPLDRHCDAGCRSTLYAMQQIRLAQGDHMRRVERVLIVDQRHKNEAAGLAGEFPGMQILVGTEGEFTDLSKIVPAENRNIAMSLFIADPRGSVVMYYPPASNASGISKDLARLLRLSRLD